MHDINKAAIFLWLKNPIQKMLVGGRVERAGIDWRRFNRGKLIWWSNSDIWTDLPQSGAHPDDITHFFFFFRTAGTKPSEVLCVLTHQTPPVLRVVSASCLKKSKKIKTQMTLQGQSTFWQLSVTQCVIIGETYHFFVFLIVNASEHQIKRTEKNRQQLLLTRVSWCGNVFHRQTLH